MKPIIETKTMWKCPKCKNVYELDRKCKCTKKPKGIADFDDIEKLLIEV